VTGAEWAQRLERAETLAALASAKTGRAETWEALGGWALNFGPGSPLSQVLSAGMNGPVTEEELAELEERFARDGAALTISLCPYADVSLVGLLGKRDYRISHFEHTLARTIDERPAANGLPFEVRPVREEEFDTATDVLCDAFFPGMKAPPELRELFPILWRAEGAYAFAAVENGAMGSCGLMMTNEGAVLAGDGTRESSRRRGMQSALIAARVRHAFDLGFRWATCSTAPGTASQRNYERAGFRVMYTKAMMAKQVP